MLVAQDMNGKYVAGRCRTLRRVGEVVNVTKTSDVIHTSTTNNQTKVQLYRLTMQLLLADLSVA